MNFKVIILILLLFFQLTINFNTSLCGYIQYNDLYYFINQAKSDDNLVKKSQQFNKIYNLCHQLQHWCESQNKIVNGSMILELFDQSKCIAYTQSDIKLINPQNATWGLNVTYSVQNKQSIVNTTIQDQQILFMIYQCNQNTAVGCPSVSKTTLWTYFQKNSLGYTIAIEVIGVLFMVLGVYMYRITIVILGWATSFIVLLTIQQTVVFKPGVPENVLENVMILTIICGFFIGYVLAYFPKAGLFCMGMWIGLIISLTFNNVCLYLIYSDPQNLPLFIMLPVLCVAFGILTMCVKRKFIIFATSLIGAYICLRALSWHLGAFPNEFLYPKQYQLGLIGVVKQQFYLYVIALLILTASSSALQFWLFKKKALKNKQTDDIDEHFNNMQNKMQNQRENLIEFENIFKKLKNQHKLPRILKKSNNQYSDDDSYEQAVKRKTSSEMSENLQMSSEQEQYDNKRNKKSEELEQKLIIKGNKKRK